MNGDMGDYVNGFVFFLEEKKMFKFRYVCYGKWSLSRVGCGIMKYEGSRLIVKISYS